MSYDNPYWWLIELPSWFKANCSQILGIYKTWGKIDNFTAVRFNPHEVRFKWNRVKYSSLTTVKFFTIWYFLLLLLEFFLNGEKYSTEAIYWLPYFFSQRSPHEWKNSVTDISDNCNVLFPTVTGITNGINYTFTRQSRSNPDSVGGDLPLALTELLGSTAQH